MGVTEAIFVVRWIHLFIWYKFT